jgi:hypothetical protein
MSQENVDAVRAIWRTFMSAGFPAEGLSEDVEWHAAADLPDGGSGSEPVRGPASAAQMLADECDCGDRLVVIWSGGGTCRVGVEARWTSGV